MSAIIVQGRWYCWARGQGKAEPGAWALWSMRRVFSSSSVEGWIRCRSSANHEDRPPLCFSVEQCQQRA